jgi:hypothetical protein
MVVFGISFCNGQQTFSKKVIIGRGEVFNIGQIWVQAYPFDLNFQMTYYSGGDQDLAVGLNEKWVLLLLTTPDQLTSVKPFLQIINFGILGEPVLAPKPQAQTSLAFRWWRLVHRAESAPAPQPFPAPPHHQ